ncbi:hypothetical protein WV31_13930 [Magnetospirillum sp. ME-1]|uniref:DUF2076 domain-containing protein n=1 Tax=Magnetospirillum sp. ME-1 TaxID=1639348 RepID=UPI000A17DEFD|nr:DUF2076 domain-containing protein [Magnetospirillum sp. ME-1]ARJ66690.1 hypothetical protein WV31_13930 [Magnetospirillum sp. ME-1]
MTPAERDLILSVFDRLSKLAGGPKDREAEALIVERLRAVPDAAYNLVEAVVVQEMAIKENEARIRDLEARLAGQSQPQQQGGGFGRGVWGRGSVPSTQAPQQQVQQQQYAPPPQQQYAQQPSPWGGQPSAGGGFLRTAAGAAVGVAGGMLLANSISSMFAGGHGASASAPQQASDTGSHVPADTAPPSYDTNIADDQGYGDFDPGYDVGGGDDSF